MTGAGHPLPPTLAALDLLRIEAHGAVLHLRLDRPAKRNAINDPLVTQLHTAFVNLPAETRAIVLSGEGDHFCAGLDLSELQERDVAESIVHSRNWHAAFDAIQFGRVPVIAVLHGAVVGGGLEIAAAASVVPGHANAATSVSHATSEDACAGASGGAGGVPAQAARRAVAMARARGIGPVKVMLRLLFA